MKSTIIITGCAGLLGSHFSRYLLKNGHKVIGIDDLSGGYADFLPRDMAFKFYQLDINEDLYINAIFEQYKPTACYHFAAYAAKGISPFIRKYNYTNNILGSAGIINACINHDVKMIFTSSMGVYGDNQVPFHESMIPRPLDPYDIAKYAIEMDMKIAGDQHGLRYAIIRPHNVCGIYQNVWDKYRNVIGIFIRQAINKEPLTIYGDGTNLRAFSDIAFYQKPFYDLLNDDFNGEIFNLGADNHNSILEIAQIVCDIAREYDIQTSIKHLEARHEASEAYCDHSKAKFLLDFSDETDIKRLISKMFTWVMHEKNRPVKKMEYEIEKNIYSYWK